MERTTKDLILPTSKAKVVLYAHLVHGDFKRIQQELLKNVRINLSQATEDSGEGAIKDALDGMSAGAILEDRELVTKLLIKEIYDENNVLVTDKESFIYNLSVEDGKLLDDTTASISEASRLSPDDKKK